MSPSFINSCIQQGEDFGKQINFDDNMIAMKAKIWIYSKPI